MNTEDELAQATDEVEFARVALEKARDHHERTEAEKELMDAERVRARILARLAANNAST